MMKAKLMQSTRPASTTSSSSQGEDGGWERLSLEDGYVESLNSSGIDEHEMAVGEDQHKGSLFACKNGFTERKIIFPYLNKLFGLQKIIAN
jgi:hypothetical protein